MWSDLCTDCREESFEPVNQENDAFTVKCVNMISTFFQSSTVTRGYFPHIMCWCGVTMSSVYRGTRRHRVMSKALQKQHNLALFPPFLEFESTFSSHNILNKMVRLAKLCGMHCPE